MATKGCADCGRASWYLYLDRGDAVCGPCMGRRHPFDHSYCPGANGGD